MPAGVVSLSRVQEGEVSDRPRSFDLAERAAKQAEQGTAGLPVGVQVVARHWREDVALAVMSALEHHYRDRAEYPREAPI
jgi:fatty acid amide hydrolase